VCSCTSLSVFVYRVRALSAAAPIYTRPVCRKAAQVIRQEQESVICFVIGCVPCSCFWLLCIFNQPALFRAIYLFTEKVVTFQLLLFLLVAVVICNSSTSLGWKTTSTELILWSVCYYNISCGSVPSTKIIVCWHFTATAHSRLLHRLTNDSSLARPVCLSLRPLTLDQSFVNLQRPWPRDLKIASWAAVYRVGQKNRGHRLMYIITIAPRCTVLI